MRYKGTCPPNSPGYRGPHTGFLQWDTENDNNGDSRVGVFPGVELRSSSVPIPQVAIIVEHLELNLRFSIISKVLNGLELLETFHLIWTKNMNIYHCGS
jgi:hypothetical protein